MDYARPELLAEPDWVASHLKDDNVRVIDCAMLEAYRRAHIPGAVHLATHYYIKESGPPGEDHGTLIMGPDEFGRLMGSLGVDHDTTVVAYDDNNGFLAARLWWVLGYYGHTKAKVLNGGWHRWLTEGRAVTFHATKVEKREFSAAPQEQLIARVDDVKAACETGSEQILDARTDAEWDGTNSRGNKRVGRVPGASHLEWVNFVGRDDKRMLHPAEELQRLVDEAGFSREKPIITYCQGGIRAAHAAFVLALLGYDDVRVYDGSMREWANREDTPLEV